MKKAARKKKDVRSESISDPIIEEIVPEVKAQKRVKKLF